MRLFASQLENPQVEMPHLGQHFELAELRFDVITALSLPRPSRRISVSDISNHCSARRIDRTCGFYRAIGVDYGS